MRKISSTALLVAALLLCLASPASAGPMLWPAVAIGDSYISGYGGSPYQPGTDTPTNQCQRSTTSPPALVAKTRLISLTDLSCAGATTADLLTNSRYGEAPQISRIPANTRLVYVMVGGNDMGFSHVLGCFVQTECPGSVPTDALEKIDHLGAELDKVFGALRKQAPRARVVVQLYPWLMTANKDTPGAGCPWLSRDEQLWGNRIQAKLNGVILKRTLAFQFRVADTAIHTSRHSLCGEDPWYYSIEHPGAAHPTLEGRWAMAIEFAKQSL